MHSRYQDHEYLKRNECLCVLYTMESKEQEASFIHHYYDSIHQLKYRIVVVENPS